MSDRIADPYRARPRLTGMAPPELISLIAATVLVIATLAFLAPEP